MFKGKIVNINNLIYKNSYWFIVSCRQDTDGVYVMEAVRLRGCDYALYCGRVCRHFIAARPENITVMEDENAHKMNVIYNNRVTSKNIICSERKEEVDYERI